MCVYFCCNLLLLFVSKRDEDRSHVPGVSSVELSGATTKAVEVCVNGVKQVIIVPSAESSNDITTVSSAAFQSHCLSLSSVVDHMSSAVDRMPLDHVPDDVRLLAESCIQALPSSSSVSSSSFDRFSISSLAATGQTCASTSYVKPPPSSYLSFNVSRMPTASLPADLPLNPYVTPHPLFHTYSNRATASSSSVVPYPSASFPAVPSLTSSVLPAHRFPPAQQSVCPISLPTPLQQPFHPHGRNPVLPGNMPLVNMNLFSVPSTASQAPTMSYSSLQMRPTYGGNNVALNMADNNYLHPGPALVPPWSPFDTLSNYRHFLPSLPSAVTPNSPGNLLSHQFADYFARKRGALPQNSAPDLRVNTGGDLTGHNCHMPQFDPQSIARYGMAYQRPPPLVNANEVQMRRGRASQRPPPLVNANKVQARHSRANQRPSTPVSANEVQVQHGRVYQRPSPPVTEVPTRHVVTNQRSHCQVNANEVQMRHGTASQRPPPLTGTPGVHIRQQRPQDSFLNTTVSQNTAEEDNVRSKTLHSASSREMVSTEWHIGRQPSQPSIPTDLQVVSHAVSLEAALASTITTQVSETVRHPATVTLASATAGSKSLENLMASRLLFDISSVVAARIVPSVGNSNSSVCQSMSNVSSSELFAPNADHADDSSQTTVMSDTLQQNDVGLDNGNSQLGDTFGDLDSLPADVLVETDESLLDSFCDTFEQSDSVCQLSVPVSCPATSDSIKSSLENGTQLNTGNTVDISREHTERQLQFAKSLGKGRHFMEEMRQRRQEQAVKRRRKQKLTSLEVADESNSSDSWHPDSNSESSHQTMSPSPVPSTASSVSRSSDDFIVDDLRTSNRRVTRQKRKHSSHRVAYPSKSRTKVAFRYWPSRVVTRNCSVMLERLHMQGLQSVNMCLVDSLICCPQLSVIRPVQRLSSSDSEASAADEQPAMKIRMKVPRIMDTDSS